MGAAQQLVVIEVAQLEDLIRKAMREEFGPRNSLEPEHEVLTRAQAAELLQIHPDMVLKHIREDGLPACKLGVEWRFRRSQVLEWLDERQRSRKGAA